MGTASKRVRGAATRANRPRRPIRKAVIPVGGLGTRFLPVTKALPKEMLPLIDVPTIQVVVEEAVAAGIDDIILVTGRNKRAIEDHFDRNLELEVELERRGQTHALSSVRRLADMADIHYIRQPEPRGLGDAILRARSHVGDEPFAVLLADDIILATPPCTQQLAAVFGRTGAAVVAVQEVARSDIHRYGVVQPEDRGGGPDTRTMRCVGLVEKPPAEAAPSDLGVVGRYILTPEIWDLLATAGPGAGGEIQLTDALARLAGTAGVYAHRFSGLRLDVGEPAGLVKATVLLALERPALRAEVLPFLKEVLAAADGAREAADAAAATGHMAGRG